MKNIQRILFIVVVAVLTLAACGGRSHSIGPRNHKAPGIRRFRGLGLLVAGTGFEPATSGL